MDALDSDVGRNVFNMLPLKTLRILSCTCTRLHTLSKSHDKGILKKLHQSAKSYKTLGLCHLIGGRFAAAHFAKTLAQSNKMLSRLLNTLDVNAVHQEWWLALHHFTLLMMFLIDQHSYRIVQSVALWILRWELRLMKPNRIDVVKAILLAVTTFPESFPRRQEQPSTVRLLESLLLRRDHNHGLTHGVDAGKTVIPRVRMYFLNLTIQLVLNLVLPKEQRASRAMVLTRGMGPVRRRRAITTVMVWANIWCFRNRVFSLLENVIPDAAEEEHADPGPA